MINTKSHSVAILLQLFIFFIEKKFTNEKEKNTRRGDKVCLQKHSKRKYVGPKRLSKVTRYRYINSAYLTEKHL